jgi:hypothetical protein
VAFDLREVVIRVRNLITDKSVPVEHFSEPQVQVLIPTALEMWSQSAFKDKDTREQFRSKVQIPINSGVGDLSDFIDGTSSRMFLPDVKTSPIYLTSSGKQITWLGTREQLQYSRIGEKDAIGAYLEGTDLFTRNTDKSLTSLTGVTVDVYAPVYPADVTQIPTTLQQSFIDYAAEYIKGELGKGKHIERNERSN